MSEPDTDKFLCVVSYDIGMGCYATDVSAYIVLHCVTQFVVC